MIGGESWPVLARTVRRGQGGDAQRAVETLRAARGTESVPDVVTPPVWQRLLGTGGAAGDALDGPGGPAPLTTGRPHRTVAVLPPDSNSSVSAAAPVRSPPLSDGRSSEGACASVTTRTQSPPGIRPSPDAVLTGSPAALRLVREVVADPGRVRRLDVVAPGGHGKTVLLDVLAGVYSGHGITVLRELPAGADGVADDVALLIDDAHLLDGRAARSARRARRRPARLPRRGPSPVAAPPGARGAGRGAGRPAPPCRPGAAQPRRGGRACRAAPAPTGATPTSSTSSWNRPVACPHWWIPSCARWAGTGPGCRPSHPPS